MLNINPQLQLEKFKEGSALFNIFTGDTHFLAPPLNNILELLANKPCEQGQLLNNCFIKLKVSENESNEFTEQFHQFVTQAINSGIILAD